MTDTINVPRELLVRILDAHDAACSPSYVVMENIRDLVQAPTQPAQVQGWRMPERIKEDIHSNLEWVDGWNECLKEVARRIAAAPKPSDDVAKALGDLLALMLETEESVLWTAEYNKAAAAYRAAMAGGGE